MTNVFEVVKAKKHKSLSEYSDYDLVKLTQEDVDFYRSDCKWECKKCGCRFEYEDSLYLCGASYIHEMKCPNETKIKGRFKKCKGKMFLIRTDNVPFDSPFFNELFARYQDRIIWESMKSHSVDYPDEIYSTLISSFLKIVLQFARDENFTSKSDKWFSSFFWRSVQNKIADMQKMNTYNKRCPTVRCASCGKETGQITTRHLFSPGHDDVLEEVLVRYGRFIYEEKRKELLPETLRKKALKIGRIYYNAQSKRDRKRIFESYCLESYSIMFPGALFKNNLSSLNSQISHDGDAEFEETVSESVFGSQKSPSENIEIDDVVDSIVEVVMAEKGNRLDEFLKANLKKEELKEIISTVLHYKYSFLNDSENSRVDSMIDQVKRGFTEKLLSIIRSSDNCRISVLINDLVSV